MNKDVDSVKQPRGYGVGKMFSTSKSLQVVKTAPMVTTTIAIAIRKENVSLEMELSQGV
jgi:hypothetical protein